MNLNITQLKYLDDIAKEYSFLSTYAVWALKWDSIEIYKILKDYRNKLDNIILDAIREGINKTLEKKENKFCVFSEEIKSS